VVVSQAAAHPQPPTPDLRSKCWKSRKIGRLIAYALGLGKRGNGKALGALNNLINYRGWQIKIKRKN